MYNELQSANSVIDNEDNNDDKSDVNSNVYSDIFHDVDEDETYVSYCIVDRDTMLDDWSNCYSVTTILMKSKHSHSLFWQGEGQVSLSIILW